MLIAVTTAAALRASRAGVTAATTATSCPPTTWDRRATLNVNGILQSGTRITRTLTKSLYDSKITAAESSRMVRIRGYPWYAGYLACLARSKRTNLVLQATVRLTKDAAARVL